MLTENEKQQCLQIARNTIARKLKLTETQTPHPESEIFHQKLGLFITLHINGNLRGCIGYIQPYKPLYESILDLSISAAFKDTRFPPLSAEEYPDIDIEISILSPLYLIKDREEIKVGRDGIFISHPYGSGLLLPQVATQYGWDRETFLLQTVRKAGLPDKFLSDHQTQIFRFEADIFGEKL